MVHVPAVTKVSRPPLVTVQTPVVADVKVTATADVAVAVSVGAVPKVCAPGLLKVIVCGAAGVTGLEAAEGTLVPIAFVAVTVQVTGVPFTSPVTLRGLAAAEAVCPPHDAV